MAKNIASTDAQLSFSTKHGKPVMLQFYAGLSAEHKLPDGTPSAWAVSFAATQNDRFMYNRIVYVHQCNIRPMLGGKLVKIMPIYHAAVVFMASDKLSHVLLIRDDSMLIRLLKRYKPTNLPCMDGRMTLHDYWRFVSTSQIYALESPEQSDTQNFHCISLPGWSRDEKAMRELVIKMSEFDQVEAYMVSKTTVMKDVDYVLDTPELKMVLHHDYVYTDYVRKAIILIQEDTFLTFP